MAHFAEIDQNNVVVRVLVVPDDQEYRGNNYLSIDLGLGGSWIQTSYNETIRKMFAGVGYTYNEELDIFLPPKPFSSYVLNKELKQWDAPIPYPVVDESKAVSWDEENQTWIITDKPIIIL